MQINVGERLVLVFSFLFLLVSPLAAQTETATIFGRVNDPAGNPVPSTIELWNVDTGVRRSTSASEEGRYRLDFVPPGEYVLKATAADYQTTEVPVILHVGARREADIVLVRLYELAPTFVEGVREIEVGHGVSTVIDEEEIDELPYKKREYQNLAILAPGVRRGSVAGLRVFDFDALSIGGRDGSNVEFTVDGTENTDFAAGVPLFEFPQEAVEEFQVAAHGGRAEKGGSAGGFVNVLTKTGTNTWQGSAFTYMKNDELSARDYFMRRDDIEKPGLSGAQFGASLGGPIVRDRTHIFAAYEGTRGDEDFFTVNTGGAFPDEDGSFSRPFREDLLLLKLTHALAEGKELTVRYNQQNSFLELLDAGGDITLESSRWEDADKYMIEGKYDWKLGPRLATRLTGFTAWTGRYSEGAHPGAAILQFPSAYMGTNLFAPYRHDTWRGGVNAVFSWSGLGRDSGHNITAGAGYERVNTTFMSSRAHFGFFSYPTDDPDTTASLFHVTKGDTATEMGRNAFSLYLQDDWLTTDRLTLTLGVRYDAETGIVTEYSHTPAVRFFSGNYDALRDTLAASYPELGLNDGYEALAPDLDNVSPRINATYDLTGRGNVLLKAGYGVYFDSIYDLAVRAIALQNEERPFLGYIIPRPGFGPENIPDTDYLYDPTGRGSDLVFLSPALETPHTHQSMVGIAFPLGEGISLEADYVNALGRNELKQRNLNFVSNGRRFLTPDYGNIVVLESIGRSRYDALLFQCGARFTPALRTRVAYTLARTDATQDGFDTRPQDNLDPLADVEFGPTTHDATHTLTADFLMGLAWGFHVSSLVLVESPRPYSIFTGQDENRDGLRNDMPEGTSRNSERGDWTFQWDARFSKKFPHQWGTSELLVDVLNITNTDNFGNNYFEVLTSESFGEPRKIFAPPRRVQLGLRHVF